MFYYLFCSKFILHFLDIRKNSLIEEKQHNDLLLQNYHLE